MRSSQAESIRKPLEQAIKALNDFFESEKKSRESAAEFEKEFDRRATMPGGTAPAIKVDRRTKKKYEQDVQGGSKSVRNRPRMEKYYPWRHCVAEAAKELARCSWTTEAEGLYRALDGLPTDNGSVDWTQPGSLQEIRVEVSEVAKRIRDILTACRTEMTRVKGFSTDSDLNDNSQSLKPIEATVASGEKSKGKRRILDESKAKKKEVEKDLCVDWGTFRDRKGGTKEEFLKQDPVAEKRIREYFRGEMKRKNIDVLTMLKRIIERNRN